MRLDYAKLCKKLAAVEQRWSKKAEEDRDKGVDSVEIHLENQVSVSKWLLFPFGYYS